jgi:L-lactate utilization protein LutC
MLKRDGTPDFLERVASAVRAGNRFRDTTRAKLPADTGYLGCGDDPVARLCSELESLGAHPHRVDSTGAGQAVLRSLIDRFSVHRAMRGAGPIFDQLGVEGVLRSSGVDVLDTDALRRMEEPLRRDHLFAADLGISAPDWAIAETGTLVYASGPEQTRSATLLPPVHLALIARPRIVADLFDVIPEIAQCSVDGVLPRNVALVTGPSKTGDIELRLTTGVHGPGELHALILDF